jgi:hypothetical protein
MPEEYPTAPTAPPPEPPPDPTPDNGPGVDPAVITTRTKDYLGRALVNIGTDARDFLGRQTKAGDLDFVGRALVA